MTSVSSILLLLCLARFAWGFDDVSSPPSDPVEFVSLTYAGTGCPQGTVAMGDFNPDLFVLLFDEYVASLGPNEPIQESRKFCLLDVELRIPEGYRVTLTTVIFRGFIFLDSDVTARQSARYRFGEQRDHRVRGKHSIPSVRTEFTGPIEDDFTVTDDFRLKTWSQCGGGSSTQNLRIGTELRLAGGDSGGEGLITTDSIDGTLTEEYGLMWSRC